MAVYTLRQHLPPEWLDAFAEFIVELQHTPEGGSDFPWNWIDEWDTWVWEAEARFNKKVAKLPILEKSVLQITEQQTGAAFGEFLQDLKKALDTP